MLAHMYIFVLFQENINTRGDPENSEVLVKYEKEEQVLLSYTAHLTVFI